MEKSTKDQGNDVQQPAPDDEQDELSPLEEWRQWERNELSLPEEWITWVLTGEVNEGFDRNETPRDERIENVVKLLSSWLEEGEVGLCNDFFEILLNRFEDEARDAPIVVNAIIYGSDPRGYGVSEGELEHRGEFVDDFPGLRDRDGLPANVRAILTGHEPLESDTGIDRDRVIEELEDRGRAYADQLIEEGKPYLKLSEVANRLDESAEEIIARIRNGKLLGFEDDDGWKLPDFQFGNDDEPLEGIEAVLGALQPASFYSALAFFLANHHQLEGRTALEALKQNDVEQVVSVARREGQHVGR